MRRALLTALLALVLLPAAAHATSVVATYSYPMSYEYQGISKVEDPNPIGRFAEFVPTGDSPIFYTAEVDVVGQSGGIGSRTTREGNVELEEVNAVDGGKRYLYKITTRQRFFPSESPPGGFLTRIRLYRTDDFSGPYISLPDTKTTVYPNAIPLTGVPLSTFGSDTLATGTVVATLGSFEALDYIYDDSANATLDWQDGSAREPVRISAPDAGGRRTVSLTRPHLIASRTPKDAVVRFYAYRQSENPPLAKTVNVPITFTPPKLTVGDVSLNPGNAGTLYANVPLKLDYPLSKPLTVTLTTAFDGLLESTVGPDDLRAVAGRDYDDVTSTVTLLPGKTQGVFQVALHGTTAPDGTRVVEVRPSTTGLADIVTERKAKSRSLLVPDAPTAQVRVLNTNPLPTVTLTTFKDGNTAQPLYIDDPKTPNVTARPWYCGQGGRQVLVQDVWNATQSVAGCDAWQSRPAPFPRVQLSGPSRVPLTLVMQDCYGEKDCGTRREQPLENGIKYPSNQAHNRGFLDAYPDLVATRETTVFTAGLSWWSQRVPNARLQHWQHTVTLPAGKTAYGDDLEWQTGAGAINGIAASAPALLAPMYPSPKRQFAGYKAAIARVGTPTAPLGSKDPPGYIPAGPVYTTSDRRIASDTARTTFEISNDKFNTTLAPTPRSQGATDLIQFVKDGACLNRVEMGAKGLGKTVAAPKADVLVNVEAVDRKQCAQVVSETGAVLGFAGAVDVNGVRLTPRGSELILLDLAQDRIRTEPVTVSFPSRSADTSPTLATQQKVIWDLESTTPIKFTGGFTPAGFMGFPLLAGSAVEAAVAEEKAKVSFTIGLPAVLKGQEGNSLPGADALGKGIEFSTDATGGAQLESIDIALPALPLKLFKLEPFKLQWKNNGWEADVGILIPGSRQPDGITAKGKPGQGRGIEGHIRLRNDGQLEKLILGANFDPAYPLGATGFGLSHIEGGFDTIDKIGKDPLGKDVKVGDFLRLSAGVGLVAGPDDILGLDGRVTYDGDNPWSLEARGTSSAFGIPLAGAVVKYTNGTSLTLSAGFKHEIGDLLRVNLELFGGVFFDPLEFYGGGYGDVAVKFGDKVIAVKGGALISTAAITGCVGVGPIEAGAVYYWKRKESETYFGCSNAELKSHSGLVNQIPDSDLPGFQPGKDKRAAVAAAAPAGRSVTVKGGMPNVLFAFESKTGVPQVDIAGPGGIAFSAKGDGHTIITDDVFSMVDPTTHRLYVALGKPPAGRYRVTQQGDSPDVTDVLTADGLDDPKVDATVSGRGPERTIRYRTDAVDGQTLTFLETEGGVTETIRRNVKDPRGSFRFRPTRGTDTSRKIRVVVNQGGVPRAMLDVASFKGPKVERLAAPRGLRVRHRGPSIEARWKGVSGADSFQLHLITLRGVHLYYTVPGNRHRLRMDAPGLKVGKGAVSVEAVDANGMVGRRAMRSFRAARHRRGR